jgi:RNA polymerase sigma-70 factor (ECF subfamily)
VVNFDELTNEHKDAIYRQMVRVCGNQADAEDVLMEALLKAYRNLDQLRESGAFKAWLAQIARRLCWQLRRRDELMPLVQLSEMEEAGKEIADASSVEMEVAKRQMKEMLWRAVDGLPPEYRDVYMMRDVEEIPGDTVAATLGISLAAMKSRLHRAREAVRKSIDGALAGEKE